MIFFLILIFKAILVVEIIIVNYNKLDPTSIFVINLVIFIKAIDRIKKT